MQQTRQAKPSEASLRRRPPLTFDMAFPSLSPSGGGRKRGLGEADWFRQWWRPSVFWGWRLLTGWIRDVTARHLCVSHVLSCAQTSNLKQPGGRDTGDVRHPVCLSVSCGVALCAQRMRWKLQEGLPVPDGKLARVPLSLQFLLKAGYLSLTANMSFHFTLLSHSS